MTVSAVHMPATPFEATGLPSVGTKIAPGEVIKVHLIFKSSTPGEFNQSVGLTTEAGETKIAVSASANTEPSPEPNPTPSPEPGPTPARTTSTTASGATVQFAPVSLSTFPNPLATLSHLKILHPPGPRPTGTVAETGSSPTRCPPQPRCRSRSTGESSATAATAANAAPARVFTTCPRRSSSTLWDTQRATCLQ